MFRTPGSKPGRGRRTLEGLSGTGGVTATGFIGMPQGRLTVASMTPVLTATDSGNTTVYYTPYQGKQVPVYSGSAWSMVDFDEVSQATTDATKSPAAVASDSNYDVFAWVDGSTKRATRGPAWSSATTRGTGAGTTELEMLGGIWVNKYAITNGPGAQRGTFLGTIRSNGSSQIDFIAGAAAASGTAGVIGLWNAYNRVDVCMFVQDTTDSWNYTTATWRSANNSTTMRVSFVVGLQEDGFEAAYTVTSSNNGALAGSAVRGCGIAYDATNALATGCSPGSMNGVWVTGGSVPSAANIKQSGTAIFRKLNDLGFHFVQAIEAAENSNTTTWYGDNGGDLYTRNGLFFRGRY